MVKVPSRSCSKGLSQVKVQMSTRACISQNSGDSGLPPSGFSLCQAAQPGASVAPAARSATRLADAISPAPFGTSGALSQSIRGGVRGAGGIVADRQVVSEQWRLGP